MAFKMKGSSLYGKLKLNRDMDKSSKDDGRAKSSAFQKKEDRPDPTYEGTDEYRKEKDIPKSEFEKRGLKKPKSKTVDLKKQSGFGPRAAKGKDDQSKELAKSRYEMGMYKNDPTKKS